MSLINKKSLYDRQEKNTLGANVGTTSPSEGAYYAANGQAMNSPFITKNGAVEDHMIELLENAVTSTNTGQTYLPSPNQSQFQDLHPGATDVWSGQPMNPSTGQFGGPYTQTGPVDGQY